MRYIFSLILISFVFGVCMSNTNGFVIAQDYDSMTGEEVYELFCEELSLSHTGEIDKDTEKLLKIAADKGFWRAQWEYGKLTFPKGKPISDYLYTVDVSDISNIRVNEYCFTFDRFDGEVTMAMSYLRKAIIQLRKFAKEDSSLKSECSKYNKSYEVYQEIVYNYNEYYDEQWRIWQSTQIFKQLDNDFPTGTYDPIYDNDFFSTGSGDPNNLFAPPW